MPAPENLANLLAVIKAKLHGKPLEGVAPDAGFPTDLFGRMLLINLLRLLPRLGQMRLELIGEPSAGEDGIFESAASVLGNWPHNFHELLRQYGDREVASGNGSYGVFKRFSGFLGPVLRLLRGDPARDWIRSEFIKFARDNWGVLHRKGASKGVKNRFLAISAYARRNGLSIQSVRRLIQDGVLVARSYGTGKNRITVVDASGDVDVAEIITRQNLISGRSGRSSKSGASDILAQPEVRRELGISFPVLNSLRKSGAFCVKDRKGLSERAKRFWFREDVEMFKQRLLSCRVEANPDEDVVAFAEIMRRTGLDPSSKHEIVVALLEGRIKAVGRAGAGINGLFLRRRQVDEVRRNRSRDRYSLSEAVELLGIRHETIHEAIKAGLLAEAANGVGGHVTAHSVDRFLNERLILGCLARQLGTRRKKLEEICGDLGIEMRFLANSSGGGGQVIIPRAREQDLISALRVRQEMIARPAETKADREQRCVELLSDYLQGLKAAARLLPRRNGTVSQLQVSRACGFTNNAWVIYPRVRELLRIADEAECRAQGLDGPGPLALLRRYLRRLGERDEPLPMRSKGRAAPNEWMIARLAGINSAEFRQSPTARDLLQEYRRTWEARHPERGRANAAGHSRRGCEGRAANLRGA